MGQIKYILIDDDLLVRKSWQMAAKKADIPIAVYSSVDAFLAEADDLAKNISIYIDYELGPELRGDIEASKIKDLGFFDLYIATGHLASSLQVPDFIKGVVGKRPPFDSN